jgi:hypothetical protein
MGKILEKAGSVLKNEGLVEKGQAKRGNAGNDEYSSNSNSNSGYGNSGSNNNNNDY